MENKVTKFIRSFFLKPDVFYGGNERQLNKLQKRLDALGRRYALTRLEIIDRLIGLAEERVSNHATTIYVSNSGSSGSHWLEAMLGEIPNVFSGGEIYLPKKLPKFLFATKPNLKLLFLEALYIVHTTSLDKEMGEAHITNSAHVGNYDQYRRFEGEVQSLFLTRNLTDIVSSRSFRKSEYRDYISQSGGALVEGNDAVSMDCLSADDFAYLEKNIKYVDGFYRKALQEGVSLHVKYEDLISQPVVELGRIAAYFKVDIDAVDLDVIVQAHQRKNDSSKQAVKPVLPEVMHKIEMELGELSLAVAQL